MATNREKYSFIAEIAKRHPKRYVGRTTLMKMAYFLQTRREVPLGYRFTLYTHGPFDSDVLFDVDSAESLGVVDVQTERFPGGYGYLIRAQDTKATNEFVSRYSAAIDWVIEEFGDYSPADLELASTIVFIHRPSPNRTELQLAQRVQEVKPHFSIDRIRSEIESLKSRGLIGQEGSARSDEAQV